MRQAVVTIGFLMLLGLAGCGSTPEAAAPSPVVVTQLATQIVTQKETVVVVVTATVRPATVTPAPSPTPEAGKWVVDTDTSSFDDSKTVILSLVAEDEIAGPVGSVRPTLILRCQEGATDAYVHVGMQPDVELGDTVTIRYRFDQESALPGQASKSTDGEALFLQGPEEFIDRMLKHEQLVFGFTPFGAPPAEMTFDLRGLDTVIQSLRDACTKS